MHLLQPAPKWFPYFGNQKRFTPFVKELLVGLGAREGDTFFETNAGSHAVSYDMATALGVIPTANDLGFYSYSIGLVLTGNYSAEHDAAMCAALIDQQGYNPTNSCDYSPEAYNDWRDFIDMLPKLPVGAYNVQRGDLFKTLKESSGDFIYCDFAWPWRDGSYTAEYATTADTLGALCGDPAVMLFSMANARRILQDVVQYLDDARKRYRFVILSNQSSNYPTPEVLEAHMRACGHEPIISRRLTVPAEHVDNLGKDTTFTEFQYVFKGV